LTIWDLQASTAERNSGGSALRLPDVVADLTLSDSALNSVSVLMPCFCVRFV
jgi:hypothetical protein